MTTVTASGTPFAQHGRFRPVQPGTVDEKVIQRRKNKAAAEKLSGGAIIIRGGHDWTESSKKTSQCGKLSHSAESTLLHCQTISLYITLS